MIFKLALAQSCHPDDGDVLKLVETFMGKAVEEGADLLAFPESLMSRFELEANEFKHAAQPIDGTFSSAVCRLAARYGIWTVYTMNESNQQGRPFNTAVIASSAGKRAGVYRKVHLFDSSTTCESSRMSAADKLFVPVETPFARIGLGICYDLRFPELARMAALQGCELLIYPAAWVDGPSKAEQWETLLRARAIENELFVAGCCRADSGYIGHSAIVAPDGKVLARAGSSEELLCAQIDTELIAQVRSAIPVFEHRRTDLC